MLKVAGKKKDCQSKRLMIGLVDPLDTNMILARISNVYVKKKPKNIPKDKRLPPTPAASDGHVCGTRHSVWKCWGPGSAAAGQKDGGTRWEDGMVRTGTEENPSSCMDWRGKKKKNVKEIKRWLNLLGLNRCEVLQTEEGDRLG